MSNVIVIGGGASGMMAAITAAAEGHQVTLIEKNDKLGKKLFITGKGRCNVTNNCDPDTFFRSVVHNSKFLYSSYYGFDSSMTMSFFEEHGVPLKTERGNRVFPASDHSSDIIKALSGAIKAHSVTVMLNCNVKELILDPEKKTIAGVLLSDQRKLYSDAVVVACGGKSYPVTGSTGDGFRFAVDAGHSIIDLIPGLVPLESSEFWISSLSGLTLKNVEGIFWQDEKILYREFGDLLFTHFGVSGPIVLSASSFLQKAFQKGPVQLFIDLKPALNEEMLDKRLLRDFEENRNRQFKNALSGLFPHKLIPVMIGLSGISPDKKIHDITREERLAFLSLIKHLPVKLIGTRDYQEAIITQGGVNIKEIDPSTMESKIIKGLYFVGEVLDLDAVTGGFNLQIAWCTAVACGRSIQ